MRCWTRSALLVAGACLALPGASAGAQPAVFADPGGVNNGEVELSQASGQLLELYVEKGTNTSGSDVCRIAGGGGDEICGFHIQIHIEGDGFIESFMPASGSAKYWPMTFDSNSKDLQVALARAEPAPTTAGSLHVGTLYVDASAPGGTRVDVSGGTVVGAALQADNVPSDTVASTPLPEPAMIVQLLSGLAALALLQRLRRSAAR